MADGVSAAPKRSARQRTQKTRVFDEATRKELKRKRLNALENDNWQQERQREILDEDDDDYNPLDDGDESGDGARTRHPPQTGLVVSPFFFVLSRACVASRSAEMKVDASTKGSSKKKKKAKKKDVWNAAQNCKSLQEVIDEADYHKYPSWVPTYASIAAAPSRYPPRRFCSVSGLVGKYKCPITGDYLATVRGRRPDA